MCYGFFGLFWVCVGGVWLCVRFCFGGVFLGVWALVGFAFCVSVLCFFVVFWVVFLFNVFCLCFVFFGVCVLFGVFVWVGIVLVWCLVGGGFWGVVVFGCVLVVVRFFVLGVCFVGCGFGCWLWCFFLGFGCGVFWVGWISWV